jgi:predicted MPP superfamily phosphohydrolase
MFHTIITLAYTIPNIYVFIRIWQVFINKGHKVLFAAIYILLASIYPVSNLFPEGDSGIPVIFLKSAANYILPFYLYLFLFMLVLDIFLLFNRIFKTVSSEKLTTTPFKVIGLSLILILSASVVIGGIINFNTIRTSEYQIEISRKSSKISHLKVAFVADFHLNEGTSINFVERFAEKIKIINPDLMIFGGDIVEGDREAENLVAFEQVLSGITARYGVFTVLGNHEHYAGQDKGSFFTKSGMKVLSDSIVIIGSSFNLAGRNDSHIRTRKEIGELLKSATDSLPLILVDHRPTEIEQVSRTSVDVQLSGHTHNGQMFPINLITGKVYELSWGYKKIGNTHFFVTSGIRLWGPPVRTAGKSEIMVIDINFTGKKL